MSITIKIPPITVEGYDKSTKPQAELIAKALEIKFLGERKWVERINLIIDDMVEEIVNANEHVI